MKVPRWMTGQTRKDRIRNEDIRDNLRIAPIENKMKLNTLR